MTKKQYYETIEQYNQMIADLQFSPLTHSVEELFPLQKKLINQIREMEACLIIEQETEYKKIRKSIRWNGFNIDRYADTYADSLGKAEGLSEIEAKIQILYNMLHDLRGLDKPLTNYEGTYVSYPYRVPLIICLVGCTMLSALWIIFG